MGRATCLRSRAAYQTLRSIPWLRISAPFLIHILSSKNKLLIAQAKGEELDVRPRNTFFLNSAIIFLTLSIVLNRRILAQDTHFHNAPPSSAQLKNPYAGQRTAVSEGSKLYTRNCGSCHGIGGRGTGNIPALSHSAMQSVPDGEVFWFITTG